MCDNNKEMFEYVMNWQSWLLRYGWKKPSTFLVFIGRQGLGKNLMWDTLFCQGVIGNNLGHVVTDMTSFQSNFNMQRLYKVLHIFNECTSQLKKRTANWDKMKAMIDPKFTVEPKGKEQRIERDPAGCVF